MSREEEEKEKKDRSLREKKKIWTKETGGDLYLIKRNPSLSNTYRSGQIPQTTRTGRFWTFDNAPFLLETVRFSQAGPALNDAQLTHKT